VCCIVSGPILYHAKSIISCGSLSNTCIVGLGVGMVSFYQIILISYHLPRSFLWLPWYPSLERAVVGNVLLRIVMPSSQFCLLPVENQHLRKHESSLGWGAEGTTHLTSGNRAILFFFGLQSASDASLSLSKSSLANPAQLLSLPRRITVCALKASPRSNNKNSIAISHIL